MLSQRPLELESLWFSDIGTVYFVASELPNSASMVVTAIWLKSTPTELSDGL